MKRTRTGRETLDRLAKLRRHVAELTPSKVTHALANLEDWSGVGYPAGVGQSSIGSNRVSDPTGEAATAALERRERDERARELAELVECFATADYALARARKLIDASATRPPTETQAHRSVGCESCGRAELRTPEPHPEAWQEVYAGALCSFCYEFEKRYGVRPAFPLVLWHLDNLGRQVPKSMIREHHPAEFRQYHAPRAS